MEEFKFLNKRRKLPGRLLKIERENFDKFKIAITALEGYSCLGDGELSCLLALIEEKADIVATDDMKARKYIINKLSTKNCIGTLGIMNFMIKETIITPAESKSILNDMLEEGYWLDDKIVNNFLHKLFPDEKF